MNAPLYKPRILIVDKDQAWLRQQQEYFRGLGYDVITAETQDTADSLFSEKEFDLVILALIMEYADAGIVLAAHFKKARPVVPILMTSDLTAETGMVFTLASAGERRWLKVDRLLAKPVRLDRLAFEAELLLGTKSLAAAGPHSFRGTDEHHLEI